MYDSEKSIWKQDLDLPPAIVEIHNTWLDHVRVMTDRALDRIRVLRGVGAADAAVREAAEGFGEEARAGLDQLRRNLADHH
jgi:hypothetical protein